MKIPNCIMGGTNKAGTTSVFQYLSDHPSVCGSSVKETGFFVNDYTGHVSKDKKKLGEFFSHCKEHDTCFVEATTSYLALGEEVIPRFKEVLEDTKFIFVLRDPVSRIFSYYNFHVSKLAIPSSISFDEYLNLCLQYEAGVIDYGEVPFAEWHLRALPFGKYNEYLEVYLGEFSPESVKVMMFEDLKKSPLIFMKELSAYLSIDSNFYETYEFKRTNETFASKFKLLHKTAMIFNRRMEGFLRQRPLVKSRLVSIYKGLNMAKKGYDEMLPETKVQLREYYSESNKQLGKTLGRNLPAEWLD